MGRVLFNQGQIVNRNKFPRLLASFGLESPESMAVEIGTHQGEFAEVFMKTWLGRLTCIDHWQQGYDPSDPASSGNREEDYALAKNRLSKYSNRVNILKINSVTASQTFGLEEIVFCYIDGCHQYESIIEDLKHWFPVIKPGGVIAGHDIICPNEPNGGWAQTVQPAIINYFGSLGETTHVCLVIELDNSPWSWYVRKAG